MESLLGHGGTKGTSPLLCALERGHAELQDERIRARDAALSPEVRQREAWIWFCRSLDIWHRHEAESLLGSDASLSSSIPHLLGHCFGAYATPGGKLALLLCYRTLRVTVSICDGPSVNAELRPWESRPLA